MATQYVKSNCENFKVTCGKGNLKLDKSIMIFNLPAGKEYTCKETCGNCYAIKAQVMYPSVLPCRISNYNASKTDSFVSVMVNLIKKHGFKTVRIHESGDFYNVEYVNKWDKIAEQLPEVKFYGYTKQNFVSFTSNNVNIVNSLLPDGNLNFGSLEYVKEKSKQFNIPVCPVTLKVNSASCGKTCRLCQTKKNMLFVIH